MPKGGKREGAGRPKGSSHKPKITDDLTEEQKKQLLEDSYMRALTGNNERLAVWFLEQIYGKPKQDIGLGGSEDGIPIPILGGKTNDSSNDSNE